jgi:hypothetical protein
MIRGCVLPHAPLLLELPGRITHPSPLIASAARSVDLSAELIVVCSTHGSTTGVYTAGSGDLRGFGLGFTVAISSVPDAVEELRARWARPLLDEEIDHGVVGALLGAGERKGSVVACCIPYEGNVFGDVRALTTTLLELGGERDILFVASAHGSASATPRAPLTERPEGRELDSAIYAALRDGPGALLDIPDELWERAGSCGAPALRVFGGLGLGPAKLLAYDAPVGVGYLVSVHE